MKRLSRARGGVVGELWPRVADYLFRLAAPIPGRGIPLHRNEQLAPFFIVGSGRSGTTLLRRILMAGGSVHIPPELVVLGSLVKIHRRFSWAGWSTLTKLVLGTLELHPDFAHFDLSLAPLAQELKGTPRSKQSLAYLIDQIYRFHGRSQNTSAVSWGDKTPANVYHLHRLRTVFPQARFVHMLRDGCDCVASYLEMGRYQRPEDAAKRWVEAASLAREFHRTHPGVCMELRYEDLVSDPRSSAARVCEFLGIAFDEAMVEVKKSPAPLGDVEALEHHQRVKEPIEASRIGRGRRELAPSVWASVAPLMDETLKELGYEACPA